ncbi:MAG: phosphoglucosamine mutase [Planctomycetes bacterium]|nr:phosphoglucosamine mutase [Planctomycetota bacterium]
MTTQRLFGTDGIRGRANVDVLTPEALIRIGRAIASYQGGARPRVVMGHDGRRSSGMIRGALAAGLLGSGCDVVDVDLVTTPGLSFLTRTQGFDLGVMISASHNPSQDNGIKVFNPDGIKIPDDQEDHIAEIFRLASQPTADEPAPVGEFAFAPSLVEEYASYLLKRFQRLQLAGMRVAVDCANGGGSRIAPRVLRELGAEVVQIACAPDGDNINDGCGAVHPLGLAARVRHEGCHLGFALDGDGDRTILADERGHVVDGDGILYVLASELDRAGRLPHHTVVATVMSNLGLKRALEQISIRMEVVGVGDRNVVQCMIEGSYGLGGEQSGHIALAENFRCGDGLYSALEVLSCMKVTGKPLSELAHAFQPFPQVSADFEVREKRPLAQCPATEKAIHRAKAQLGDSGRVVVRYSGTELKLRIMVEGPTHERISAIASEIASAARSEIPVA